MAIKVGDKVIVWRNAYGRLDFITAEVVRQTPQFVYTDESIFYTKRHGRESVMVYSPATVDALGAVAEAIAEEYRRHETARLELAKRVSAIASGLPSQSLSATGLAERKSR